MAETINETTNETINEDELRDEDNRGQDTDGSSDGADDHNPDETVSDDEGDSNETFPRSYVEELREENKRYRLRAKQADELAQRLHRELVAKDGRLQDPTDLPFNDSHLEDPEALSAAIDDLLDRKPHLKSRKVRGDVGAGTRGSSEAGDVDLIGIMKGLM